MFRRSFHFIAQQLSSTVGHLACIRPARLNEILSDAMTRMSTTDSMTSRLSRKLLAIDIDTQVPLLIR